MSSSWHSRRSSITCSRSVSSFLSCIWRLRDQSQSLNQNWSSTSLNLTLISLPVYSLWGRTYYRTRLSVALTSNAAIHLTTCLTSLKLHLIGRKMTTNTLSKLKWRRCQRSVQISTIHLSTTTRSTLPYRTSSHRRPIVNRIEWGRAVTPRHSRERRRQQALIWYWHPLLITNYLQLIRLENTLIERWETAFTQSHKTNLSYNTKPRDTLGHLTKARSQSLRALTIELGATSRYLLYLLVCLMDRTH